MTQHRQLILPGSLSRAMTGSAHAQHSTVTRQYGSAFRDRRIKKDTWKSAPSAACIQFGPVVASNQYL